MNPDQERLIEDHVLIVQAIAGNMARERFLSWHDTEEMVDDARLALVQIALSYDPETGIPFEAYLRSQLGRRMIDALRKRTGARYPGPAQTRNAAVPVADWEATMPPASLAYVEPGFGEVELRDQVLRRMHTLTVKERDAFLMYVDGFGRDDIADVLEVSISRVSQLVIRAREKLFHD